LNINVTLTKIKRDIKIDIIF